MVVLLTDPWAVLSPGFWLSFGAVALIFYVTANRLHKLHWLHEYGKVQWAMMIGLIPPLLALFQQLSLVAPVANAFAIPLVSFVVVPLTLLGTLPPLEWMLYVAHEAMVLCMFMLKQLDKLPYAVWTQHAPPVWTIVSGVGGALWILAPRGFPMRLLGILLLLPMFLIVPERPASGSARLVVFDVGQGLAVAVQTRDHAMLFDTGPAFSGEADSGNRILLPALRGMGIEKLDTLVLSHGDTDHIGGTESILRGIPVINVISSLPNTHPMLQFAAHNEPCVDGQSWEWDGVYFEILHPDKAETSDSFEHDNDRSCVLRVSTGQHSVLLAADAERESELRLLKNHRAELPSTLLVVPHHGSKSSSSQDFVEAVHPRYAMFTSGYLNRFGHPKEEIVERYRAIGSEVLRSDEDGAVSIAMDARNFRLERYRESHARYWQHDAKP
jgi:competence protein ComEC